MNKKVLFISLTFLTIISCSVPKSYFTVGIRNKVESKQINVDKLQFYVDRDVELRRELSSGDTKVTSGKIKFENGKYIHIILLKQYTPGICTNIYNNRLDISFEVGEGKKLTFGVSNDFTLESTYQIFAEKWEQSKYEWQGNIGQIKYDNNTYYIQGYGSKARLMIKKSIVDKLEIEKRTMKGRKL